MIRTSSRKLYRKTKEFKNTLYSDKKAFKLIFERFYFFETSVTSRLHLRLHLHRRRIHHHRIRCRNWMAL